jgi:RNA polymerase sigma-70 factor (ECF subfamily)
VRRSADFEEFYQASYGRVVGMLTVILDDRAGAEDAAQEAFARALVRWSRLGRYELPEAWVRRVALRLAIDSARRSGRAERLAARLATGRPSSPPGPGDALGLSPVGAALRRLPLTEREVLVLHYVAGLPIDAIAQERGLPPRAVKTRLAAGRRHLERELTARSEGARDDG